jgi:hypothetical protein
MSPGTSRRECINAGVDAPRKKQPAASNFEEDPGSQYSQTKLAIALRQNKHTHLLISKTKIMKNIIWILMVFCVNISVAGNKDDATTNNDNEVLSSTGCKVECLFGSCECTSSGGGSGCFCGCFYGWPECGGGAGGRGSMNANQSMHADAIKQIVTKFESEAGMQLQSLLDEYIEIMKNKEECYEIVQSIRKTLVELSREEKDQFNDYLINNGVQEIIK